MTSDLFRTVTLCGPLGLTAKLTHVVGKSQPSALAKKRIYQEEKVFRSFRLRLCDSSAPNAANVSLSRRQVNRGDA